MNLRQLRYLLAIADQGSFTRAAEHIPISQSSLSRHVRLLEEELGVEILIRTGRGVVLTEEGQFICERMRSIFEQIRDVELSLRNWSEHPAGLVRVGMPPTMIQGIAATVVSRLTECYPEVTVRLSELLSRTLMDWLVIDKLDLAVVFDRPTGSALKWEKIGSDEICLVVPKGFACPNPVSIEEIASHKIIAPQANKRFHRQVAHAFEEAGQEFHATYEIDSQHAMKDLVRIGAGVATLPRLAVQQDVEAGELEVRRISSGNVRFEVCMVYAKAARHSRAVDAVAEMIRERAADFLTE